MADVFHVATYLISKANVDEGDGMTHLKLQKLLYYCQGFAIIILGQPLFENKIEAWLHGPVVVDVYDQYKSFGGNIITVNDEVEIELTDDEKDLIDEVYSVYGQFSAWSLRNLTHNEPTWLNAENKIDKIITVDAMQDYFSTLVKN